jgi:hypothetical protein
MGGIPGALLGAGIGAGLSTVPAGALDAIHTGTFLEKLFKWMKPGGGGAFNAPPEKHSMNYIPNDAAPRFSTASWQPPPHPKPVTTAITLNLDGRTLAQSVSTIIADLHDHAIGAPASNAYADYVGPDNQTTTT